VKPAIQLCTTIGAAFICALLWFSFWFTAFNHPSAEKTPRPNYPRAAIWTRTAPNTIQDLRAPTRFAFPSKEGFSGNFPESHVRLKLSADQPKQPQIYLQTNPFPRKRPEQPQLYETVSLPHAQLTTPATTQPLIIPQPERISLFFSPELAARIDRPMQLLLSNDIPQSIRIHLNIQPDGTVSQALFDTPVKNNQLAGAVRQLRFAPALTASDGWMDIRLADRKAQP